MAVRSPFWAAVIRLGLASLTTGIDNRPPCAEQVKAQRQSYDLVFWPASFRITILTALAVDLLLLPVLITLLPASFSQRR